MTNKEKYKVVFGCIEPSEETTERILNMTKRKKGKSMRTLAVIAAVLLTLICAMVTANAASDGEIAENVRQSVEKFIVYIDGKPAKEGSYIVETQTRTDKDGNEEDVVKFRLEGENFYFEGEGIEDGSSIVGLYSEGDIESDAEQIDEMMESAATIEIKKAE